MPRSGMHAWMLSYPKPVGRRDWLSIWRWRFGTGSVMSRDLIILSFPFIGYHTPFKMTFGYTGNQFLVWIYTFQPVRLRTGAGMSLINMSCLQGECVPLQLFSRVGLLSWAVARCKLLCPWDSPARLLERVAKSSSRVTPWKSPSNHRAWSSQHLNTHLLSIAGLPCIQPMVT